MNNEHSEINFKVKLDENKIPVEIEWSATDQKELSKCKAAFISIWDEKEENTLKLDLWTREMLMDEMKLFYHQQLLTMADTFERATGDEKMSATMRDFCEYFAEKLEIYKDK
jgi:gliding motility-associated protein GldC